MSPKPFSSLLDSYEVTFHDSTLLRLDVDFVAERATARFEIIVDNASVDGRPRGTLTLDGLLLLEIEPAGPNGSIEGSKGLWITGDGEIEESADSGYAKVSAGALEGAGFAGYFFSSDTNSFLRFASRTARFEWDREDRE